ncbi:hypothetical protein D3C85_1196660 [compost metagenome]
MAFLDRVGGVHYVQHQVGFADVFPGDVFVLFDGVGFGINLFLEAEQPRGVDQYEVVTHFVHLYLIGRLLMADFHTGSVKLFHPGRSDRRLAFGEATNQRHFEFFAGHAVDRG